MKSILFVILSFALFLGGLALFGYSVTFTSLQALGFFAGILCISLSFAIPVHVLTKTD